MFTKRFSRYTMLVLISALLVIPRSFVHAAATPDQEVLANDPPFGFNEYAGVQPFGGANKGAQAFAVTKSGVLDRVELSGFGASPITGPNDALQVSIQTLDMNGLPSGTILVVS